MPAIPHSELINAILEAIDQSGESGVLTSAMRTHPRRFAISGPFGPTNFWVYAWTLTPGGRPQLRNEYRIQMTSVASPLQLKPDGFTILIGYEPSLKMFAGFDIERHKTFTSGSPSVQIDITSIHKALQDGLAFHRKENNEIAVGIRPDQFMTYVHNAVSLHKHARHRTTFTLLNRASSLEPIPLPEIENLTSERQRIVQMVSRLSRSANFRQQVLNAYGHRCAVTRLQLQLVEAAHVLPAAAPGSLDHVVNGIALSPTYHRAYDNGLIFLDETFTMHINSKKESTIIRLNMDGGLRAFKASLGKIHLPADRRQWPDVCLIRKANRFRRVSLIARQSQDR